jgi:hypothetical protein
MLRQTKRRIVYVSKINALKKYGGPKTAITA